MFTRQFQLPDRSFFLFGPRGTGKTTWLRKLLPDALWFDLLRTQTFLELSFSLGGFCGPAILVDAYHCHPQLAQN
jgi:hypothetical protein